jgi:hypothetical protein
VTCVWGLVLTPAAVMPLLLARCETSHRAGRGRHLWYYCELRGSSDYGCCCTCRASEPLQRVGGIIADP